MEIRWKSISYLTYKNRKTSKLEKQLEISILEQNFTEESKKKELINKKNE